MHFQEVGQQWSWHCQRDRPALYSYSPISTKPSPRIALFSLQPLILPTGEDFSSDSLAAQSHPRYWSCGCYLSCYKRQSRLVSQYKPGPLAILWHLRLSFHPPLWLWSCILDSSAVVPFTTSLAKHKHQVRAAVHQDKPIIHHHHVQSAEGFHPLYDPAGADHGGAGWWGWGIT